MRAVLDILASLVELITLWLRQRYAERREADRVAVRDDAGGEWGHSPAGEARNLFLWIKSVEARL